MLIYTAKIVANSGGANYWATSSKVTELNLKVSNPFFSQAVQIIMCINDRYECISAFCITAGDVSGAGVGCKCRFY